MNPKTPRTCTNCILEWFAHQNPTNCSPGTAFGKPFILRGGTWFRRYSTDLADSKAHDTYWFCTFTKNFLYLPQISWKKTRLENPSLTWRNLTHIFTFWVRDDPDRRIGGYRKFFVNLWMYPKQSVVRDYRFWASRSNQVPPRTCAVFGFKKTLTESTYQY